MVILSKAIRNLRFGAASITMWSNPFCNEWFGVCDQRTMSGVLVIRSKMVWYLRLWAASNPFFNECLMYVTCTAKCPVILSKAM